MRIFEVTPVNDKKTRAQSVQGRIAMGMVYFPAFAPWWMEARQELLQFPFGARDDFVDALAWIGTGLNIHAPPKAPRKKTPQAEIGTYGWLKDSARRETRQKNAAERQGW